MLKCVRHSASSSITIIAFKIPCTCIPFPCIAPNMHSIVGRQLCLCRPVVACCGNPPPRQEKRSINIMHVRVCVAGLCAAAFDSRCSLPSISMNLLSCSRYPIAFVRSIATAITALLNLPHNSIGPPFTAFLRSSLNPPLFRLQVEDGPSLQVRCSSANFRHLLR